LRFALNAKNHIILGAELPASAQPTHLPGEPEPVGAPPRAAFTLSGNFTSNSYFFGNYLPTLLLVLYGMCWDMIYVNAKQMEPFFRLNAVTGASATDSLLCGYTNSNIFTTLRTSFTKRHGVIMFSTIVSILIKICTPLAAEAVYVGTNGTCTSTGDGSNCYPYLALRPWAAWTIEIVLIIIFLMVVPVTILISKRQSGIYSEATSIAGIAVLCQDHTLMDMTDQIQAQDDVLSNYRYKLGRFVANHQYGIHLFSSESDDTRQLDRQNRKESVLLTLRPYSLGLFWLSLVGLLVLIQYYYNISTVTGFERFMDSQGFGVRLMMTTIGVLIKLYWTQLDGGM